MADKDSKFLPTTVRPVHYDLRLTPDLDKKKFYGEVQITVEIKKPVKQIKMHQKNLELNHETSIKQGDKSWQVTGTSDDNKEEIVVFKFPEEIPKHEAAVIHIKWTGDLTKELDGLYRTTYTDAKGKKHSTISTQFEATSARRCFPCFDEPKSKATFNITVVLEARFHVLSNMPPDTEDNIMPNVYPPMREWRFQKTPPMSTYLIGITAGEWDRVERKSKNGALVRTWGPLGKVDQIEETSAWATKVLDHFDSYFNCPYVLPKMDIVPVQDFSAGAMENWGVITFREKYVVMTNDSTVWSRRRMKEVVAHEIAHMWFGNLVTPRSWDALWLKEGFATYFAYHACSVLEPNGRWMEGLNQDEQLRGRELDAKASTHALESTVSSSGEIAEVYDAVSYSKGASLVKFVSSYVGADAFQEGLRNYINQFKFKNAASLDLWLALGKASKASGPALKDVMKDWVKQEGFPVVTAEAVGAGKLKLSQRRMGGKKSSQKWTIPIRVSTDKKADELFILDKESQVVDVAPDAKWVLVNSNSSAFVVVHYAGSLRDTFIQNFTEVSSLDQLAFVHDQILLFGDGKVGASDLVSFFASLSREASPIIWEAVAFWFLHSISVWEDDNAAKTALQKAGRDVLGKIWELWGSSKKEGEHELITRCRGTILQALCHCDDKKTLLAAQEIFDAKGALGVETDMRSAVWSAVAGKGHRPSIDALFTLFTTNGISDDVAEAAGAAILYTRNTNDVSKLLKLYLLNEDGTKDNKVKGQSLKTVLANGLEYTNHSARGAALSFVRENFKGLCLGGGGAQNCADNLVKCFGGASDDGSARTVKDMVNKLDAETKSYCAKVAEQTADEIRGNSGLKAAHTGAIRQLK